MMDVLLLRFNVIRVGNISRFCLQSASRSYASLYGLPFGMALFLSKAYAAFPCDFDF